jgi:uncharacterized membrane protein
MANQEIPKGQPTQEQAAQDPETIKSVSGCLIRMLWMVYGLVLFMISLVIIAIQGKSWGGVADIAFCVILALCIGGRMLDHPALKPSRRKYAIRMVVVGAVLWGIAHLIGNLFLAS